MSPQTLHLTGLSRDDEAALKQRLDSLQPQLQSRWSLTAEAHASVLLIDMDSMYGQMALMKARSSGKRLIALTEGARADTHYLLRRPFDDDDLANLLNRIAAETQQTATVRPAPVAADPPVVDPPAAVAPPIETAVEASEPAPAPLSGLDDLAAPDFPLDRRYRLDRWPQIDRSFPKHFRIATVMLKGSARPAEIAEATGASLSEVCAFIQARLASGHASEN